MIDNVFYPIGGGGSGLKTIIKGTASYSDASATNRIIALSQTIDPSKSFVILDAVASGSNSGFSAGVCLVSLTSTQLTIKTQSFANGITISYQVVEFE